MRLCSIKLLSNVGGGGGGEGGGGQPGRLPRAHGAHGAHNNDIHVFLVYSNSF